MTRRGEESQPPEGGRPETHRMTLSELMVVLDIKFPLDAPPLERVRKAIVILEATTPGNPTIEIMTVGSTPMAAEHALWMLSMVTRDVIDKDRIAAVVTAVLAGRDPRD
jgi:hypothetical protein